MQITVSIRDGLTPELNKKIAQLRNRRPLLRAAGQAAVKEMKAHYRSLPPNDRFQSRKFWKKEGADKTQLVSFDDNQATVVVDSVPMAHKYFGGTVTAKGASALSIPISAEAYKVGSASLFPKPLTMVSRKGRPPLLIETGVIGKSKAWKLHYVLMKSVTHRPDPRAFPPVEKVRAAVMQTIRERLALIMRVSR